MTPVVDGDVNSVELGTAFTARVDGTVTGVRFWKTQTNTGIHTGRLWDSDGTVLAQATFSDETDSGWQTAQFSKPVEISAGERYVASYHAPAGGYVESVNFMGQSDTDLLSVERGASGVYAYGSTPRFPRGTWRSAQYWVDVKFVPADSASQPVTPSATPSATATATESATPSPSVTPTSTPTSGPTHTSRPTPSSTPSSTSKPSSPPTGDSAGGQGSAPPAGVDAQASVGTGWRISPSTVGLAPHGLTCSQLPAYSTASHVIPAGTVIDKQRLTTWYDLSAGNITIKNSCVQPTPGSVGQGSAALSTWQATPAGPITIEDSEYDGSLLSSHEAAWIGMFNGVANFYRNYIHDSGSGLALYVTGEKTGSDVVVQNNYIDHLVADGDPTSGGNHESALTVRDFDTSVNPDRQLLVRDNYFNCDGANATGAFFIQPNDGDVKNVTVQGNLLAGYGFQFYLDYQPKFFPGLSYANIRAIDNRMDETHAGAVFVREGGPGVALWQDNYTYSATGDDGKGSLIPNPNP